MQLKDSVIIITGGGQGLGRAMAEYLAAKGARLALVDLNQERLDEAVAAGSTLVRIGTAIFGARPAPSPPPASSQPVPAA